MKTKRLAIEDQSTECNNSSPVKIHFSDFFEVSQETLDDYGAFNISLINDLPLFVDPFLLFNSKDSTYRKLHDTIISYVRFLRDISIEG